jgi:2-phospho-L-lactate transferase/gluconeogenesis factor (CofD/UPF0052 family)
MGFPWKRLITVGRAAGSLFIPGLETAIQAVEAGVVAIKNGSGPEKKAAAIAAAEATVRAIEGAADADLLDNAKVQEATGKFVDAYVASMNAQALALQAKDDLVAAFAAARSARGGTQRSQ